MISKLKKQEKGFTIIEVLIVLAIAGLIILIVFLAVPALQRNSRNTQRKNDVSAISGALNEYIGNNNGALPATCAAGATGCGAAGTFLDNAKVNLYDKNTIGYTKNATAPAAASIPTQTSSDAITIASYLKCNGSLATTTGATARSAVILYAVETGGGTPSQQCVEL